MRITGICLTAAAALGVAALGATPAQAAKPKPSYTVKVGATTTGAASLTANGGNGYGFFDLSVGGKALSCATSTSSVTATLSPTSTGKKIAKIGPTTWSRCYTYDGVPVNVTTKASWLLNVVGPADSNGLMPLTTAKVSISVIAPGGQCSYLLTGSYGGTYNNANGALALGTELPALVVSNYVAKTSNCDINGNGDHISPNGSESVTASSPTGAFTVTRN